MIRHFVVFNFNPEIERQDREWLFDQIRNLSTIPSVKHLAIGKLLEPQEEWYKPRLAADYAWAVSMEFDDEAGLYAYQADAYHVMVAQEIRQRVSTIKVMDFVSLP